MCQELTVLSTGSYWLPVLSTEFHDLIVIITGCDKMTVLSTISHELRLLIHDHGLHGLFDAPD